MRKAGYTFASARVYKQSGEVDANGAKTMANAWKAGFTQVDGYIFP
jgi:hypothetical protein